MSPAGPATQDAPATGLPESSARPKFTSRAAVLAVVLCAIALSLAYPIREYLAERRQIGQLETLDNQLGGQVARLHRQQQAYSSPAYIEQQARDQLHMCFPAQKCYIVIYPSHPRDKAGPEQPGTPWYGLLWKSVREADRSAGT